MVIKPYHCTVQNDQKQSVTPPFLSLPFPILPIVHPLRLDSIFLNRPVRSVYCRIPFDRSENLTGLSSLVVHQLELSFFFLNCLKKQQKGKGTVSEGKEEERSEGSCYTKKIVPQNRCINNHTKKDSRHRLTLITNGLGFK